MTTQTETAIALVTAVRAAIDGLTVDNVSDDSIAAVPDSAFLHGSAIRLIFELILGDEQAAATVYPQPDKAVSVTLDGSTMLQGVASLLGIVLGAIAVAAEASGLSGDEVWARVVARVQAVENDWPVGGP